MESSTDQIRKTAIRACVWISLTVLHQEAPPERPLPSLAAGSATPAQAQLKHHHPVKYEVDPKSTAEERLAPMRSGILQDALEVDMYF